MTTRQILLLTICLTLAAGASVCRAQDPSAEEAFRVFSLQYMKASDKDAKAMDVERFESLAPAKAAQILHGLILSSDFSPGVHHGLKVPGHPGQTWSLWVPEDRPMNTRLPVLFMPGHAAYRHNPQMEMESVRHLAKATDCLVVRPNYFDGLVDQDKYDDMLREDLASLGEDFDSIVEAILREVFIRANGDPDRVYLTGFSMAGYWSWELALTMPYRFAGVMPVSAASEPFRKLLPNCGDLPAAILHGDADDLVPVTETRETRDILEGRKQTLYYKEVPGAGHTGVYDDWHEGFTWLRKCKRDPWPKSVLFAAWTPKYTRSFWVQIETGKDEAEAVKPYEPICWAKAQIKNGTITVTAGFPNREKNAGDVRLLLSPELVDFEKPLTVKDGGGQVLFDGDVKPSVKVMLENLRRTGDTRGIVWGEVRVRVGG